MASYGFDAMQQMGIPTQRTLASVGIIDPQIENLWKPMVPVRFLMVTAAPSDNGSHSLRADNTDCWSCPIRNDNSDVSTASVSGDRAPGFPESPRNSSFDVTDCDFVTRYHRDCNDAAADLPLGVSEL